MAALAANPSKNPSSSEEAMLVDRAVHGDAEAFERLLSRHKGSAYRFALALTKNPDDAADVLSTSLIGAFRGIRSFRGASGFATWLHRVILNCFNDARRKSKRWQTITIDGARETEEGDGLSLDVTASDGNPEQAALASDVSSRLRLAVNRLDPTSRRLVELRHFEEMPYSEIAAHEHLPVGTVKSRMHRARRAMRTHLIEADM